MYLKTTWKIGKSAQECKLSFFFQYQSPLILCQGVHGVWFSGENLCQVEKIVVCDSDLIFLKLTWVWIHIYKVVKNILEYSISLLKNISMHCIFCKLLRITWSLYFKICQILKSQLRFYLFVCLFVSYVVHLPMYVCFVPGAHRGQRGYQSSETGGMDGCVLPCSAGNYLGPLEEN